MFSGIVVCKQNSIEIVFSLVQIFCKIYCLNTELSRKEREKETEIKREKKLINNQQVAPPTTVKLVPYVSLRGLQVQ